MSQCLRYLSPVKETISSLLVHLWWIWFVADESQKSCIKLLESLLVESYRDCLEHLKKAAGLSVHFTFHLTGFFSSETIDGNSLRYLTPVGSQRWCMGPIKGKWVITWAKVWKKHKKVGMSLPLGSKLLYEIVPLEYHVSWWDHMKEAVSGGWNVWEGNLNTSGGW